MYQKKPTPFINEHTKRICPVCGKQSYSAGGIHPQCAVQQADAPRQRQLKANKEAEAKSKSPTTKPPATWNKKKCPECGLEVHSRQKACTCGFEFFKS
jgi:hypothetical protein